MAGGLIESDEGLLLVCNRRRNGSFDWSPPGGVIEVADGESLARRAHPGGRRGDRHPGDEWAGPVYEVQADAVDLGWRLRAEVHVAVEYEGELRVDDPDGIVVDARFVALDECASQLAPLPPVGARAAGRVARGTLVAPRPPPPYGYRVDGSDIASLVVTRVR